jgi:hypothetical protein
VSAVTESVLDVRGLVPCEPMERILAALDRLGTGERLRAVLDREPLPLYPLIGQRGFEHRIARLDGVRCELLIWHRGDHAAVPQVG